MKQQIFIISIFIFLCVAISCCHKDKVTKKDNSSSDIEFIFVQSESDYDGIIRMLVTIDKTGKPIDVKIVESTPEKLDENIKEAAIKVVKDFEYKPITNSGEPIYYQKGLHYRGGRAYAK